MNEATTPITTEDAAWASVHTPLKIDDLKIFCQDIERLFRINPMLEFNRWENLDENEYRMVVNNVSQESPFELDTKLRVENQDEGLTIHYSNGLKKKTVLTFEATGEGSKLTIIDDYTGLSEDERKNRLHEVDRSLTNWVDYLQRFMITWQRWSRFAPWRWYMRRIWQPMKPVARRITYILLWISVVEVALIALGVSLYYIEYK